MNKYFQMIEPLIDDMTDECSSLQMIWKETNFG